MVRPLAVLLRAAPLFAALAFAQAASAAYGGPGMVLYTATSGDTWCGTGAVAQMNFSGARTPAAPQTGSFSCVAPGHYYGAYYFVASPAATATPTNTICNQDLDGDGLALDAPVAGSLDMMGTGVFTCQRYDNFAPTGTVSYLSGWTNNSATSLTAALADTGASNVASYRFEYRTADANPLATFSGAWIPAAGTGCTASGYSVASLTVSCDWTPVATSGNAYEFQVLVWDNGNNLTVVSAPGRVLKFDNTPPTAADVADVQGTVPQNAKFYASTVNYALSVDDGGGSPIVAAAYALTEMGGSNPVRSSGASASTSSPFAMPLDMTDVDFKADAGGVATRNADGTRTYTLAIGSVTDEAGNTATVNKSFTYFAIADARSVLAVAADRSSVHLSPADGAERPMIWKVTDPYGNAVVPDAAVGRTVSLAIPGTNGMQLDQVRRQGASALFASEPSALATFTDAIFPLGAFNYSKSYASPLTAASDYADGAYRFRLKAYVPTASARPGFQDSDVAASLQFGAVTATAANGSVAYDQTMALASANGVGTGSASTPAFRPLYDVTYVGDYRDGISPGHTDTVALGRHESTLTVTNNSPSVAAAAPSLGVMFTAPTAAQLENFDMTHGAAAPDTPTSEIDSGSLAPGLISALAAAFPIAGASAAVPMVSDLTQSGTADIGAAVISFHVSYALDGHDVAYNGDALNRPSYWGAASSAARQMAAKVTGIVSNTEGYQAVDTDQQGGVLVLGNASKFASKTNIRKNAFAVSNGLDDTPVTTPVRILDVTSPLILTNNGGRYLANAGVVLYKGVPQVAVGDGSDVTAAGRLTLLVVGGDVYIKNNVSSVGYDDASVGIAAVADENGVGGSIYVDPSVTNIDAVLYADKALVSASDLNANGAIEPGEEMGGNTRSTLLRNQLLIYGSVISENTLGGAVNASGLKCPYFVPEGSCDQDAARKYDLNYLRRYRLATDLATGQQSPAWNGMVMGSRTCGPACTASPSPLRGATHFVDTDVSANAAAPAVRYATYPLVVEYNPRSLSNPPPVFGPAAQ